MEIGGSNQRIAADTKLFYMKLLTTPLRDGKVKTVKEVSSEYPVTSKSLYEWYKDYQMQGDAAFEETPRKVSTSKSSDLELQEEIFKIARLNPLLSSNEIIKALSPAHKRITAPTVQKILKIRNLNTLKLRVLATEYDYVKKHLPISKQTLDYLIKKNPYLDLLQINTQIAGSLFYLKCLDLTKLFGPKTGYLLLAVDTKSLTTFSQIWDGKYLDVPVSFVKDLSKIFGKKDIENFFETDDSEVFIELKNSQSMHQISWLDSGKYYFSPTRFEVALSKLLKQIRIKFLKNYTFTSLENFHMDLEEFLFTHRTTDGPAGYPTFGHPPYHLNKHNS